MKSIAVLLLAALFVSSCATAPQPVATKDSDTFQIETTVLAVYNVLSGPAGRRDWERFEDLFAPDGRMIFVTDKGARTLTPKEYAVEAKPDFDAHSWFAHPVVTEVRRSGDVAQVWSAYETREASNQEQPTARGAQSFQMVRIGGEWKVLSMVRDADAAAR